MKRAKTVTIKIISIIILLWSILVISDYFKTTHSFKKPTFTKLYNACEDGGSGTYMGLGYSIEIEGNFMPEDKFPGVTYAKFNLFKIPIKEVRRD